MPEFRGREELTAAVNLPKDPEVRGKWSMFNQDSLNGVVRAVSREVKTEPSGGGFDVSVSPGSLGPWSLGVIL
ncbi:MAG: hypothetical protein ACLFSE_01845 [Spirochaetia bacterium]